MILVLGAGLAGISCSYHLNHECLVVEKKHHAGGHIYSHQINGFTWDEGPHVSFTKHKYVKDLFAKSLNGEYLEYPVYPTNYYKGHWINHPAQSNLYAVPEPIRTKCLNDFLSSRNENQEEFVPKNYEDWAILAFGNAFYEEFVKSYTQKYWTVEPKDLTTDWVGGRVFFPDVETVKRGFIGPLDQSTHYITSVRYPEKGGYFSYTNGLREGMNVELNKTVERISLASKTVYFADGSNIKYSKLINTLPLPEFVRYIEASPEVNKAANDLACSELLLINYVVNHRAKIDAHWFYVYDADKYATRVNFTELLSPQNGQDGKTGIQVEVYFSKYRPQIEPVELIVNRVLEELIEMGLVESHDSLEDSNTQYIKYANVICDLPKRQALETIFSYLEQYGLVRESDDLEPMTDWDKKLENNDDSKVGDIVLAGRFGQWKYFWTDDCILRGKFIANKLSSS